MLGDVLEENAKGTANQVIKAELFIKNKKQTHTNHQKTPTP